MLNQLSWRGLLFYIYVDLLIGFVSFYFISYYPDKPMYIITIFNNHSLEMFMVKNKSTAFAQEPVFKETHAVK